MNTIDAARRLAQLGQIQEAQKAYSLVINEGGEPAQQLEGALYILQSGGGYQVSYTVLLNLYNQGFFQAEALEIMTGAFYQPNARALRARYDKNCKALAKYPYLFRKDFLPFDQLPIQFYPYDDSGYLPFHREEGRFDGYVDVKTPVVSRNFFADLDKPVLAGEVFSQYELEYLHDNVRPSEAVGRDNHIYLHYGDWGTFCAWLQVLDFRPLLKSRKFVLLVGPELEHYPINFQDRFQIDYSKYPVKPVSIREINRLIWHAQLSTHNGGDFFNEVFDNHPNLLTNTSLMMDSVEGLVSKFLGEMARMGSLQEALGHFSSWRPELIRELFGLKDRTGKDVLVALFLNNAAAQPDYSARIVPAVFFQPHFENIFYSLGVTEEGCVLPRSEQADQARQSPMLQGFRYVKTFVPMRRPTTSYGATIRFMVDGARRKREEWEAGQGEMVSVIQDTLFCYLLNRSFMASREDRLYRDSRLVRFEDGKLNPEATFRALAAFLDLPYTGSMRYCSYLGQRMEGPEGEGAGFDPGSVYRTYDNYANDAERRLIEYYLRDVYEFYGYGFQFWDGKPMDGAEIQRLLGELDVIDGHIRETWTYLCQAVDEAEKIGRPVPQEMAQARKTSIQERMEELRESRRRIVEALDREPRFVDGQGQPLAMMARLEPVPELLERPLYR